MWGPSIVGFGSVTYPLAGGKAGTTLVIGFSPRKPHLVLYGMGIERHAAQVARLGGFKTGKGCLYIKRLADIDAAALAALIASAWADRAGTE